MSLIEGLAKLLHVLARHTTPKVADHSARNSSDGRTGDNGWGKEDSHHSAYGNPRPGSVLRRLFVLVDVNLPFGVFLQYSSVVRAYHTPIVQFFHRCIVYPGIFHAVIRCNEYEYFF